MRYIKVLILAIFIFLALVFFFQNQAVLSQQMELTLNLFYWPPMTSIPLPFYFLVLAAFFVGCLLSLCLLIWDRFTLSAKVLKNKWKITSLEKQVGMLTQKLDVAEHPAADSTAGKEDGIKKLPAAHEE